MVLGVLIVHEQRAHAEALEALIDAEADLRSVGVVTAVEDVRSAVRHRSVDVVLIDLALATSGGITSYALGCRVVAVAEEVDLDALEHAVEIGATWFVGKDAPASEVLSGLRNTAPRITVSGTTLDLLLADARGWLHLPPSRARRPTQHVRLTRREDEVLQLMRDGRDAKSIASELHVSIHTARSHIKKLMAKLGAHSQLEAVAIANRLGVATDDHGR